MAQKTLTKKDLLKHLMDLGLSKGEGKSILELFFEMILTSLEQGQEIKLTNFGTWSLKDKQERPGCNPKTKEKHTVSARKVVKFRPSTRFKKKVENAFMT